MASATQTPQSTLKMTAMFGQTSHTPARPFTAMPAGPGLAPGLMSGAMPSTKEVNTASFCKIGQELSQDIVQKTLDVYQTLKLIQVRDQTFVHRLRSMTVVKFYAFLLFIINVLDVLDNRLQL